MEGMITMLVVPELLVWVGVLIVAGLMLKHMTRFPNGFIWLALFSLSFLIAAGYGVTRTAGEPLTLRLPEVLLAYGVGQGFLLTMQAVLAYDAVHGTAKVIRSFRDKRVAAKEIAVDKESKAATKAKGRRIRSSLVRNLITMACAMILSTIMMLPFGIGAILDFVSQMIVMMLVAICIGDIWYKAIRERWKLCWQYWIGLVLVLGADWAFLWASKTTAFFFMWIALGLTAVLAGGAGFWFACFYKPEVKKRAEEYVAEFRKSMESLGVAPATADKIIEGAKEE